ncbi:MAG: DUF4145 domain-containing protein [Lachnospiraceae bacterium]|jgi:uncharacterized protein YgiM (DUF1202 family)|nr:DUF4145 domain-containing protein [Lachnospiraceae bacterium]
MASGSTNNNWERIQLGLKNTERLIGQKDYNSAMIKARQTIEFMVRMLSERSGSMSDRDLKEMIDMLYRSRRITKNSCDHYHKIRMIGNKAAHEGDNSASNATLALQLLAQEFSSFSEEYQGRRRSSPQRGSSQRNTSRRSSPQNRRRRSAKRRRRAVPAYLFRLLIPVAGILLIILIVFFVIRLIKPKSDEKESTTSAVSTESIQAPVETSSVPETTQPPETSTEAPQVVYVTTDVLNVRSAPNTEGTKLGKLNSGVTVNYVRAENDEWAVILYDGQEAYVASQYLTTQTSSAQ